MRRIHLCLSVRGALNWSPEESREALKWLTEDGRPFASVHEMREALMDELVKGNEVIPYGPCDNFDPKNGCRGHDVPDTDAHAAAVAARGE